MTSLYPGLLFYSTGLNKKSTPVKPEATPSEIDRKLSRTPFNGRPWPRPSPVSNVYDVRNSSTRMIILNNKLSRKPKGSRLRGQTDHSGDISLPEPERHAPDVKPHTNWEHHKQCSLSVSEKFVPRFPPTVATRAPAWVNQTQRPAMKFDNGSGVNPNHHIQCQGHMDMDIVRWYNSHAHRRPPGASRSSSRADGTQTATSRALSPILNNPDLTRGEKKYLNHIAKIYSVENMRQQKVVQYNTLMWKEVSKGSYKEGEWEKYARYLATPRKTQFGPCDPFREKRSTSTPGLARIDRGDSRPYTSQTGQRSAMGSSRKSLATAPARSSNTKDKSGSRSDRSRQQKSKVAGTRRQSARHESPLPPPVERKPSIASLSSLEEGDSERQKAEGEKDSPKATEQHAEGTEKVSDRSLSPKTSPQGGRADSNASTNAKHSDLSESSPRATGNINVEEEDGVEKRKTDDDGDDERSKMSARDPAVTDEQRGASVEYRPTMGEREGDKSAERVGDGREKESPKSSNNQGPETYTQSASGHPEGVKQSVPLGGGVADESVGGYSETNRDSARDEYGDAPASSVKESEPDNVEEVVRLAKTPESMVSVVKSTDKAHEAEPAAPASDKSLHSKKEGKDRPLSRLGGREQFQVVQKDRENSDDDYSDDEGEVASQRGAAVRLDDNRSGHSEAGPRAGEAETSPGAGPVGSERGQEMKSTIDNKSSTQEKPSDISTIEY